MDDLEQVEDSTSHFTRIDDKPLYEQVTSWLLSQVSSGRWPMHHMLPPEISLAQELGVSRVTLRRAMSELVRHGIFTRISGRGTFVAIQERGELQEAVHKVSLVQQRVQNETRLIGVIVPDTSSAFVAGILAHLEHVFYERGYRMLLTNSRHSLKLQEEQLHQLVDFGVDGIILYSGPFLHDQSVSSLVRRKFPLVMLDRYYPAIEKNVHIATSDHARGAYLATEYLLRLGHRRIGFVLIKAEIVTSMLARFDAYKAALKDYGLEFEEDLVMQAGISEETVRAYLTRVPDLSAVFVSNDANAIEFLYLLRKLGIRVPDDLSLIGFDDIPPVSRLDPPLTTIAQNVHQLGEASAHLLIDTIEGRITEPQSIVIPTELVIRQSCAPYKGATADVAQPLSSIPSTRQKQHPATRRHGT
jgi:GntR family transcriptional regulator of arabinose operon